MSSNAGKLKIRFKFKDDSKAYRAIMTKEQYNNFKVIAAVEFCEITERLGDKLLGKSEDELRDRLEKALGKDHTHIASLSQD